ncbi:RNA pseudouridine synthase [Terrihabitans soli]|uniref:RNA pseudouridine synthase n=1 Tax=Terrihabitans soli TaxID=708113 RepID=A0A6S6QGV6_9HYPH|nr:RNA pseudouridine synthase [Terrihabitans soli]BCJ89364.1 RNA pseudouridine synthase [Terrihabitans soli]
MNDEDILTRVLFRDALMLVLDKPAGIAVHAGGAVRGPTLDSYFDALRYGLPRRPELAHRLDRETSGCLVLGRHRKSIADLNLMFREGNVGKIYLAVVEGGPDSGEGEIDLPIGPKDKERGWHQKVDLEKGLPARTGYKVLGRADGKSLVELNLHTGRTHQLRVHMAALGCPILGDRIYGNEGGALHLHSWRVSVPLYPKKDPIRVEAPLPAHFVSTLNELKIPVGGIEVSRV